MNNKMKKFSAAFKSIDIYGHPIGVHYKGNSTFQTKLGSLMTLFSFVFVTIYAAILVTELTTGESQEVQSLSIKVDLSESGRKPLDELEFMLTYVLVDDENKPVTIPTNIGAVAIGWATLDEVNNFQTETAYKYKFLETYDYIDHESYSKQERFVQGFLQDAKVVNFTDTALAGSPLTRISEIVSFVFIPCQKYSDECASAEEFAEYFLLNTISMYLGSDKQYIDFDNRTHPIQRQFDPLTDQPFQISPFYKSKHTVQLAQNEFNAFDNPWNVLKR